MLLFDSLRPVISSRTHLQADGRFQLLSTSYHRELSPAGGSIQTAGVTSTSQPVTAPRTLRPTTVTHAFQPEGRIELILFGACSSHCYNFFNQSSRLSNFAAAPVSPADFVATPASPDDFAAAPVRPATLQPLQSTQTTLQPLQSVQITSQPLQAAPVCPDDFAAASVSPDDFAATPVRLDN